MNKSRNRQIPMTFNRQITKSPSHQIPFESPLSPKSVQAKPLQQHRFPFFWYDSHSLSNPLISSVRTAQFSPNSIPISPAGDPTRTHSLFMGPGHLSPLFPA